MRLQASSSESARGVHVYLNRPASRIYSARKGLYVFKVYLPVTSRQAATDARWEGHRDLCLPQGFNELAQRFEALFEVSHSLRSRVAWVSTGLPGEVLGMEVYN